MWLQLPFLLMTLIQQTIHLLRRLRFLFVEEHNIDSCEALNGPLALAFSPEKLHIPLCGQVVGQRKVVHVCLLLLLPHEPNLLLVDLSLYEYLLFPLLKRPCPRDHRKSGHIKSVVNLLLRQHHLHGDLQLHS